jgi:hypothetical protein
MTKMAALVLSMGLAASASASEGRSGRGQEGTWRMEVTTRDCSTGAPLLSFRASLTFARGGTMTGTTASPAFRPGQRTPDHGVWRRTGRNLYEAASEAFILFDSPATPPVPPVTRGWQWIGQEITIDPHDPDVLQSDARTEFYDMAGNELSSGCATAVGRRFELE